MAMDLVTGAAKDLVTGAVGSLISKLGKLLYEEYKLQKGVPEKIVFLIKELERAHDALHVVDDRVPPDQLESEQAALHRIWARQVREASYDMEDVLDTFLVSARQDDPADQTDQQSLFEKLKRKMTDVYNMVVGGPLKRRKITVTVDDIHKRLQEVTQRRHRFDTAERIVSEPAAKSNVDPRLAAMYKQGRQLVGIKKPRTQLISMLSLTQGDEEASNKKMKIVSIVGTGGLGKTTLARAVYDNDKVNKKFECQAFVSVGQNPDFKKVFRDVLIELDKEKYMDPKYGKLNLSDELRGYLRSRRYFIAIDDIWEIESWNIIKPALVQDNCGISRVITTTRKLEVARECGEVYKLEPLPFDKSEKLFCTRIFGSKGKCPDSQLDEASNKMLKKCDGVPLAIITVASLLVGKSREEWIQVCHSIVFRDKNKNQQVTDTEWILSLSYL